MPEVSRKNKIENTIERFRALKGFTFRLTIIESMTSWLTLFLQNCFMFCIFSNKKNSKNRNILTDNISLFPIRIFIFHQRIVYSFSLVNGSLRPASREARTKINIFSLLLSSLQDWSNLNFFRTLNIVLIYNSSALYIIFILLLMSMLSIFSTSTASLIPL